MHHSLLFAVAALTLLQNAESSQESNRTFVGRDCSGVGLAQELPDDSRPQLTSRPARIFIPGQRTKVFALAFSTDNTELASGGYKVKDNKIVGHVQLWNVATGKSRHSWSNGESVSALAFSPDGATLASGGGGMVHPNPKGTIRLWDARSGQLKLTLKGHANEVGDFLFSRDGSLLASSARYNKEVRLWNTRNGTMQSAKSFDQRSLCRLSLARSPSSLSHLLAAATNYIEGERDRDIRKAGTGTVELWNLETRRLEHTLTWAHTYVWNVAMTTDGRLAVGEGGLTGNRQVRIWDSQTGEVLREVPVPKGEFIRFLRFSPDSTKIVSVNSYSVASPKNAQTWKWRARVWDVKTGNLLMTCQHDRQRSDWTRAIAFSPDGKTFVIASNDGVLTLWTTT